MPGWFKLPEGTTGVSIDGQNYDADENGVIEVGDHIDPERVLKEIPGCVRAAPPEAQERESKPGFGEDTDSDPKTPGEANRVHTELTQGMVQENEDTNELERQQHGQQPGEQKS